MGFKEELQKLSVQVLERKKHITNEEMTKQSLIVPFFQVLGFDVFNPLEVRPEYDADFGKKKGEKVDYAIFKDDKPIFFVEAKSVTENLSNHDAQLSRYFNSVPEVRFGILTNGVEYRFFTDLDSNNIMDDNPFLIIDITNLSNPEIESLSRFKKDTFNTDLLVSFAEELIYTSNLNKMLGEIFRNPPDDFIRYLIKGFIDSKVTQNVIDRFRPIVKKSISYALLNIVSQGLLSQEEAAPTVIEGIKENPIIEENTDDKKAEVTTTDEELRAFDIVKDILESANRDTSEIQHKDTLNYFGIHNKNTAHWFLRLNFNATRKNIVTKLTVEKVISLVGQYEVEESPKGNGLSRIYINQVEDLKRLNNLIIECFDSLSQDNLS